MKIHIEYQNLAGSYFIEEVEVEKHWTDYYIRDWFFNYKDRLINYTSIKRRKDLDNV